MHFTLCVGGCGAGEAFAKYCGFNFVECKIHVSPGHRYQPDWTVDSSVQLLQSTAMATHRMVYVNGPADRPPVVATVKRSSSSCLPACLSESAVIVIEIYF